MTLAAVLVRTHSPGNLGAAARAAKCFGAELFLVDPRAARTHEDARAFASGAEDVLDAAPALGSLAAVPGHADRVVALTALRGRDARGLPPAARWAEIRGWAARSRVALVFGPERGGLTTDELRRCDARATIATQAAFPTLSVSQAVAAALALAQPARAAATARAEPRPSGAAPASEMRRLLEAFEGALLASGYAGAGRSRDAVFEMQRVFLRARPTSREVTLLLGALAALGRGTETS